MESYKREIWSQKMRRHEKWYEPHQLDYAIYKLKPYKKVVKLLEDAKKIYKELLEKQQK